MAREGVKSQSAKLIILLAFALMMVPVAQASILSVGGTAPPSPLFPTGPTLASTSGTITTPTFTDTYSTWVVRDPGNTFCANCLDFIYVYTLDGPDVNERFSMSSFAGFMVDVGTNPFGVHDPITVDRSSITGAVVGFNFDEFGDEMQPGQTTVDLVIETNAVTFTSGFLSAQDGTAGSGVGFAPQTAIPEPSSMLLMGSGLLALGGFLRRSRNR
jgi:PEP-CTERM motif